jgi:hypothetical protein
MIVSVRRDDLRDEFTMADEAFALSPISARATQPREEDYNAISEAFMETSRGRWFLGEYAKRNRNADTRMVLDAVARIEETIAAQKKPAPDNRLPEALAAIKEALAEARASATAALDELALEENLAPARKGARVIREIAWRLREIGADGRICDLIDSQVKAIEAACGTIAATDPMPALGAAFDLVAERIKAFDASEPAATQPTEKVVRFPLQSVAEAAPAAARVAEEAISSPAPAAQHEAPAAADATVPAASSAGHAEAAVSSAAMPAEPIVAMAVAAEVTAEAAVGMAEIADPSPEATDVTDDSADAHDEAVLDMIAFEMAAPDPDDVDGLPGNETYEAQASEAQASESQISEAQASEVQASRGIESSHETRTALPPVQPIIIAERAPPAIAPAVQPAPEPEPSPEPSLGSSLIASGIVRGPTALRPDPLAAIRRMSQAEKVAFFS